MELSREIYRLTEYGVKNGLIKEEDRVYVINKYLEVFLCDEFRISEAERKEIVKKLNAKNLSKEEKVALKAELRALKVTINEEIYDLNDLSIIEERMKKNNILFEVVKG